MRSKRRRCAAVNSTPRRSIARRRCIAFESWGPCQAVPTRSWGRRNGISLSRR
jgi:hypothetical protein